MTCEMISLRKHPQWKQRAAEWFHSKWNVPLEAYLGSMNQCIEATEPIPQWYIVKNGEEIIGGLGVIENDFHERKDLTPNVCAVFVEKDYRCRGIAESMLDFVCADKH